MNSKYLFKRRKLLQRNSKKLQRKMKRFLTNGFKVKNKKARSLWFLKQETVITRNRMINYWPKTDLKRK